MLKQALVAVALIASTTASPAQEDQFPEGAVKAQTVMCDTPEQIKSALGKIGASKDIASAVNAEAGENACEAGFFVFMQGPDGEVLPSGWTLQHVLVVGITKGNMLVPVQPTPQWTAYHTPAPKGDPA